MRKKPLILTIVVAVVIVSVTALTVRILLIRYVRVPTGSMMNTVLPGDELLVLRSFGMLERGQIVIFQYPDDPTYVIGRIVGLPGETIKVTGKEVYINERLLPEERVTAKESGTGPFSTDPLQELSTEGQGPYRVFFLERVSAEERSRSPVFVTEEPVKVPDNFYFIMADNRDDSEDSRYRGPVPRDLIWGYAYQIYYSETMDTGEPRWDRAWKRLQ